MLFQNLSREILKRILCYLTSEEICRSLIGLTKNIDDIIQDYPMNIFCLSKMKPFERYSFRCRMLILTGSDLCLFQKISSHWNLQSLRTILLRKMNGLILYSFLKILPIEQLRTIIIKRLTWFYYPNEFYSEIWSNFIKRLNSDHLQYLSLPFHICHWRKEHSLNLFFNLESLTLEYISSNQMLELVNNTPNIQQLKVSLAQWHKALVQSKVILRKLSYLELTLYDNWSLQEIEHIIRMCPYVQYLIVKLEVCDEVVTEVFEPNAWQRLIEEKLTGLISLYLQINHITSREYEENRFDQNEYWNRRKPKFQVTIKHIRRLEKFF